MGGIASSTKIKPERRLALIEEIDTIFERGILRHGHVGQIKGNCNAGLASSGKIDEFSCWLYRRASTRVIQRYVRGSGEASYH